MEIITRAEIREFGSDGHDQQRLMVARISLRSSPLLLTKTMLEGPHGQKLKIGTDSWNPIPIPKLIARSDLRRFLLSTDGGGSTCRSVLGV
jgi:hypothetical protein